VRRWIQSSLYGLQCRFKSANAGIKCGVRNGECAVAKQTLGGPDAGPNFVPQGGTTSGKPHF
jgi:hypothetical protein